MAESPLNRLWNFVVPTSSTPKKPLTAQQRKQRKFIYGTACVIAAGVLGWVVYSYIAAAPQRAQKQFDEAFKLTGPGNYDQAIAGFTKAINTWPDMASAYVERGLAHHYLNQDDDALADLDRALALDSSIARAYAIRAGIFHKRGQTDQAIQEYGRSIQAAPNVDAYFELGEIYEAAGQHQKAVDNYSLAISYLPTAPYIYRARAFAKQNVGDEAGAEEDRKTARSYERR